jgi:hypothetical protein
VEALVAPRLENSEIRPIERYEARILDH